MSVFNRDVDLGWSVCGRDMGVGSLCVSVKADVHRGVVAKFGKLFFEIVQEFLGFEWAGYLHVRVGV
jgi:hypothetical protein